MDRDGGIGHRVPIPPRLWTLECPDEGLGAVHDDPDDGPPSGFARGLRLDLDFLGALEAGEILLGKAHASQRSPSRPEAARSRLPGRSDAAMSTELICP